MQNVLSGFLLRWLTELGGIFTIAASAYFFASPSQQEAVQAILTGQGGQLSLNTYIGLAIYALGRWNAYRATVKPQVVTEAGQKITPMPGSIAQKSIETQAKAAPKAPTLWERLFNK